MQVWSISSPASFLFHRVSRGGKTIPINTCRLTIQCNHPRGHLQKRARSRAQNVRDKNCVRVCLPAEAKPLETSKPFGFTKNRTINAKRVISLSWKAPLSSLFRVQLEKKLATITSAQDSFTVIRHKTLGQIETRHCCATLGWAAAAAVGHETLLNEEAAHL